MPPQQHRLTTTNPNLTLTTTPNRVLDTLTSCNFEVPRLRWYEQLIHIFSSNGLTRTVTSTVYGGTRARRIPPHTIIPSSTLHPSSPSPSPTPSPGPRELWGFRLHMMHQLSPRQAVGGVPDAICASA